MTLEMAYNEKYREGMEKEKEDLARRMLKAGKLTEADIAEYTGLSIEKIRQLQQEM